MLKTIGSFIYKIQYWWQLKMYKCVQVQIRSESYAGGQDFQ